MAEYRLYPSTDGGSVEYPNGEAVAYNLGLEFYVTTTCWVTHVWFWYPPFEPDGTTPGNRNRSATCRLFQCIDNATGKPLGVVESFADGSFTGWQSCQLSEPIQLTANPTGTNAQGGGARYRAIVLPLDAAGATTGFVRTPNYWTVGGAGETGISNGPLIAPPGLNGEVIGDRIVATGEQQMSFSDGAGGITYTNLANENAHYWVDVTVTDTAPEPPAPRNTGAFFAFF